MHPLPLEGIMARQFIKLARDIYRDPKLRHLRPDQKWVWVAMLCVAHESLEPGVITDSIDDLAFRIGMDEDLVRVTVADLRNMTRPPILEREDGAIVITNWSEHQSLPPSQRPEQVSERVKRWREKQKQDDPPEEDDVTSVTSYEKLQDDVTSCNGCNGKRREEIRRE